MWTIYTYWNSTSMISALNGVALIMGGANFLGLMQTLALLGLLTAAGVGLFKVSFKEPGQYLIMLLIFYGTLFVPKVTVNVTDLRTGGVGTVSNIPLGVAFIATSTSHIGKWLTETFETNFAASDELSFSKTGMAWGAGALKSLAEVRPQSPKAQEAFASFARGCVVPEIIQSSAKYLALVSAPDVLATLAAGRGTAGGFLNPGRVVSMPNRTSDGYTVVPCITATAGASAYDFAVDWLTTEVAAQRGWLARKLLPDAVPSSANTLLGSYLPGVEGALIGGSRTITQQLMQSMAVNLMNDSAGSVALTMNDPAAVQLAVGTVTAQASAISAYRVMGMIGEEALPKFRNIVEIMLICVFPLVLLVIVLAGEAGGAALKTYAMTAVWVQLWAPLYAIINNMLMPMTASRFQASLGGTFTQNMQNTAALVNTGFTEQAMAGALVMAVPVIAYALVRGGEVAMSSATSSLMAPASGQASSQGAAAGLGNVSMGTTSWGNHSSNNTSGNKWDDNSSISSGKVSQSSGLLQSNFDTGTGQSQFNAEGMTSNLGSYGAQVQGKVSQAAQNGLTQSQARATEASTAYASQAQSAYSNFLKNTNGSGTSNGVTKAGVTGTDSSTGQSISRGMSAVNDFAKTYGISREQAFSAIFSAGGEASAGAQLAGSGFKASMGGSMQAGTAAKQQEAWNQAQKIASSSDFKSVTDSVNKSGVSTTGTTGATATTSRDQGRDATLSGAKTSLEQARKADTDTQAYQQAVTSATSMDGAATKNLANKVVDRLGGVGAANEAYRTGNNAAIEKAISDVAHEELQNSLGGNFGPNGRNGGQPPALGGGKQATADGLKMGVETKTGAAAAKVDNAGTLVADDAKAQAGKLARPTGTATVNGQSAGQVQATAAAETTKREGVVAAGKTEVAGAAAPVKTEVANKAAAVQNHTNGDLQSMVVSGVAEAAVDQLALVGRVAKASGNTALEGAAALVGKSSGQPPAPAAAPAPPPPPVPGVGWGSASGWKDASRGSK